MDDEEYHEEYSSSGEGRYRRGLQKGKNSSHVDDEYYDYDYHKRREGSYDNNSYSFEHYHHPLGKKRKFSGNRSTSTIHTSKNELNAIFDEKLLPLHKRLDSLEKSFPVKRISALESQVKELQNENRLLKERLNHMDTFSRRNNIRFYGIDESEGENCEAKILEKISSVFPNFNDRTFERIHRLGSKNKEMEARPIIGKVFHFKDKLSILARRADLLKLNISISDDFCPEVERNRRPLIPIAKEAYKQGMKSKLVGDKLYVNNKMFTKDNLDTLPSLLNPDRMCTQSKNNITAFYTKSSPLSNFFPCSFKVDGDVFNCGEQYLTVSKARLFKDKTAEKQLFSLQDPSQQKRRGYKIKNYEHGKWNEKSKDLALQGLYHKFSQNPDLKQFLLSTNDNLIVEASIDKVWGCGLKLNDKRLWDKRQHTGENRLGTILMNIRDQLKIT